MIGIKETLQGDPTVSGQEATNDNDVGHWICCVHENLALCGKVTDGDIDPDANPDCPVCNALMELDEVVFADVEYCVVCPLFCRREAVPGS